MSPGNHREYTSEGGTQAPGDNHTSDLVSLKNSLRKHASQELGSVSRGVSTASGRRRRSHRSGARSWGATDTSRSFDESGPFGQDLQSPLPSPFTHGPPSRYVPASCGSEFPGAPPQSQTPESLPLKSRPGVDGSHDPRRALRSGCCGARGHRRAGRGAINRMSVARAAVSRAALPSSPGSPAAWKSPPWRPRCPIPRPSHGPPSWPRPSPPPHRDTHHFRVRRAARLLGAVSVWVRRLAGNSASRAGPGVDTGS